jgi:pimeloyl-ACP methyl ester carboxylesterase
MITLILPGFSFKNKAWTQEAQKKLAPHLPVKIISWPHWQTGQPEKNWLEKEAQKIIKDAQGHQQINILAKSIGTIVAMVILKSHPQVVNKLLLCGLPLGDLRKGDDQYFQVLKKFPAGKILCLQNENDTHGRFSEAKKFIHLLNPKIKILSQPRSDHQYPYFSEFIEFLKQSA